jgi:hypothetical protein
VICGAEMGIASSLLSGTFSELRSSGVSERAGPRRAVVSAIHARTLIKVGNAYRRLARREREAD